MLIFFSSWLMKPAAGNYFNLRYWAGMQLLLDLQIYNNTKKRKRKKKKKTLLSVRVLLPLIFCARPLIGTRVGLHAGR